MFVYCVIGIKNISGITGIPMIYGVFTNIEDAYICKNIMSCESGYLCNIQQTEVK